MEITLLLSPWAYSIDKTVTLVEEPFENWRSLRITIDLTYLATIILLLFVTITPSLAQGQQYQLSQQPQTLQPKLPYQAQPQQQQPAPNLIRSPCPRAIKINTNNVFRGRLHFICLQSTGANGGPRLEVIEYASQRRIMSKDLSEPAIDQLASFVDESGTLRILLAVPDRLNGTSMYSIDGLGQVLNETHTINTQYVSTLSIWKMELNWEWHLAIANQPTYDFDVNLHQPVPDPRPMISLLSWRSTYFDQYQLIYLPEDGRVNKLEPMHIFGQEFLIVAMESNRVTDQGLQSVGLQPSGADSIIYKLDFGDGSLKWKHYQSLYTQIAFDVKSFSITHKGSLQRDYYVAMIGQAKNDPMDMTSYHHNRSLYNAAPNNYEHPYGLIIYKYFGDQFRRTEHSLAAPGAIKLDTITYGAGDSYVIIALLSGGSNHVNLYLFDGLMLKLMPGPFGRPPPIPPANSYPYLRQRRTMENSANLHLFMVPPTDGGDESNDTINLAQQKRTLSDESMQTLTMPALALSTTDVAQYENIDSLTTNETTKTSGFQAESVYQIPINDLINIELERLNDGQNSGGYNKRNYVGVDTENLLNWCKAKIGELLADNFNSVAQKLLSLPRIDQSTPIELVGDLIVEEDLHVSNLLYARQIRERIDQQQSLTMPTPPHLLSSRTFEQIQLAHREIELMEQRANRILVDDGSEQEIFSPLSFDLLIVECLSPKQFDPRFLHTPAHVSGLACPYIVDIRTTRLNSRNISNIRQQAMLTGRPMEIRSDVRFEHLVLRGQVSILDSLNGININDIVFKRGPPPGSIMGHKNFMSGLYSSSRIEVASWEGMVVDRNNFLTSTGIQRIEASLRFAQVIVDSPIGTDGNISSRIEKLNGIHMDTHLGQIAMADDQNNFETQLYFDELILNGPVKFTANSRLCQIDVENLWLNTMFKHSVQNITAPMHFSGKLGIAYGGDILVDGPINGVLFHPDSIMMRNDNRALTNPVVFDASVAIRDLILDKALNGIQVINNPATGANELAILYNGGTQQITGDKVFDEVHLGGSSLIRGLINGHLNISQLYALANKEGMPHKFSEAHLSGPKGIGVADGINIHIDSTINGIPTNDLCALANRVANSGFMSHKRLKFDQPINFKSLSCASINGFNDLTRSFLTRGGNQLVMGHLKLMNGAVFNSSIHIQTTLNSMQIGPLSGAISRTVNETRSGHKDVRGDLVLDELFADRIEGLNLANVFLSRSDEPQFIRAPIIFDHLDIENVLVIGRNLIINSFNGLNVTDILTNTLQYDTPQIVYNHVELGTLQLLANTSFSTRSLNGHDLQRLYADSVLNDVEQQILAPKWFRAPVEFVDQVTLRQGIDELTGDELRFHLLLHGDEGLFEGDVEFMNNVSVKKELEIKSAMINEMDINQFVDSVLYENRADRKPMRVVNGSVRFHDVKVNNLVVGGKIQNIDLSREALLKNDNLNGTYDARIKEQQALINNQRLINNHYGPGASFKVSSEYRGANHQGTCYVHSCAPIKHFGMSPPPPMAQQFALQRPPPVQMYTIPQPQTLIQYTPQQSVTPIYKPAPTPAPHQYDIFMAPPLKYVQQFYPNILPTKPLSLFSNHSTLAVWKPNWDLVINRPQQLVNQTVRPHYEEPATMLTDPKFLEHKLTLQAQAIADLAYRINKYLSISFYYEIIQKHPLLGPLLHAASNPIANEQGTALLLLKGTSKMGEPCLRRGQTIAAMTHRNNLMAFTQSSLIRETSDPISVDSVVVEQGGNYLFVLDSYPKGSVAMVSQVIVYLWDHQSGMYELRERIVIDGFPTAMRAFASNQIACFAIADPKLVTYRSNQTGAPTLHCQEAPNSKFSRRIVLPLLNVFDFDIVALPKSAQIVMATLSQQDTEQIGDLSVGAVDLVGSSWTSMAVRRMVRPIKLHFFRDIMRPLIIRLAVSEAITSSDNTQALTRIFALKIGGAGFGWSDASQFEETQVFRDNQFYDIQSVHLNNMHSMLFFQSAHSISIYAPANTDDINYHDCNDQYSLVQRLPTKGANKFLVFNNNQMLHNNYTSDVGPFEHILVLSKDDCEQQRYATLILKAKFKKEPQAI